MSTTRQIESVLNNFKDTEENGLRICKDRPTKYSHDKFSEFLKEAREKEIIRGWYCESVNEDRTYFYIEK